MLKDAFSGIEAEPGRCDEMRESAVVMAVTESAEIQIWRTPIQKSGATKRASSGVALRQSRLAPRSIVQHDRVVASRMHPGPANVMPLLAVSRLDVSARPNGVSRP